MPTPEKSDKTLTPLSTVALLLGFDKPLICHFSLVSLRASPNSRSSIHTLRIKRLTWMHKSTTRPDRISSRVVNQLSSSCTLPAQPAAFVASSANSVDIACSTLYALGARQQQRNQLRPFGLFQPRKSCVSLSGVGFGACQLTRSLNLLRSRICFLRLVARSLCVSFSSTNDIISFPPAPYGALLPSFFHQTIPAPPENTRHGLSGRLYRSCRVAVGAAVRGGDRRALPQCITVRILPGWVEIPASLAQSPWQL